MRASTRRKASALCALALLSTLVACATPAPPPEPSPTATTTAPVFATDAEALAAATEAYAAFSNASDDVFNDGGTDAGRISAVTSAEYSAALIKEFDDIRAQSRRSIGRSNFDGVTLQQIDESAPRGTNVLSAYLCADISGTDVVDATGISVITSPRPSRTPFLVTFDWKDKDHNALVVSSQSVWNGDGVC